MKEQKNMDIYEFFRDESPVAYQSLDKDGNILEVNNLWLEKLGYERNEVLGEWFGDFLPEDYVKTFQKTFKSSINNRKNKSEVIYPIKTKKGTIVYAKFSVAFKYDSGGNFRYTHCFFEDITEIVKANNIQSLIRNILELVLKTESLTKLLDSIREELSKVLNVTNFYVALYNEKMDNLEFICHYDEKCAFHQHPARNTLTGYVIKTGNSLFADEKTQQELMNKGEIGQAVKGTAARIWIGVPLKTAKKIIGAVCVQSYDDTSAYSKEDMELLELVSDTIALAISRKQSEEALRESERRLSLALESTGLGLWDQNFKNGTVYRNEIAANMLGFKASEVVNETDFVINRIHPDDLEHFRKQYAKVESGEKQNYAVEHRVKTKNGSWKWIYNWGRVVERDNHGAPLRSIGTYLDITQLKETEHELLMHQEHLELVNSILRHDIANTFAVIQSALNLFRKNHDETMLDEAKSQIKKGISLLNKMKRLEHYFRQATSLVKIDLAALINEIASSYSQLKTTVTGNAVILADEAFSSVFDNLFANALKHGKADKIEVEIIPDDKKCSIVFKDDGYGIPDQIKNKIFDEAFKSGPTGNTGLGLYIVKKTIDRYGGEIRVEDNKPRGAKFIINLLGK